MHTESLLTFEKLKRTRNQCARVKRFSIYRWFFVFALYATSSRIQFNLFGICDNIRFSILREWFCVVALSPICFSVQLYNCPWALCASYGCVCVVAVRNAVECRRLLAKPTPSRVDWPYCNERFNSILHSLIHAHIFQ